MSTQHTTTAQAVTKRKSVTCNRCGAVGLTWKRSQRTKRWFLSESVRMQGYSGRIFTNEVLHRCPPTLSTNEPTWQSVTVYGYPIGPSENPKGHQHRWLPWRSAPGSTVTGSLCAGCMWVMVD